MRRTSEGAIELTSDEIAAVARRLVARHLTQSADWVLWEDLPELSELTFLELCAEVAVMGTHAKQRAVSADRLKNIDSVYLISEARG